LWHYFHEDMHVAAVTVVIKLTHCFFLTVFSIKLTLRRRYFAENHCNIEPCKCMPTVEIHFPGQQNPS